jgi:hypothetical protein
MLSLIKKVQSNVKEEAVNNHVAYNTKQRPRNQVVCNQVAMKGGLAIAC